jgi:hypothetical protein
VVGKVSYRVQQLDVRVETKTLDNVFITAVVSIQYQVLKEKVRDSWTLWPAVCTIRQDQKNKTL